MTSENFFRPSTSVLSQTQFMCLFLEHQRELLRYVMVLVPNVADARDVLQDAAISLWESIEEYDASRPFLPWASRFAWNRAHAFLRKERRRKRLLSEEVASLLEVRRVEMMPQLDTRREHLADCIQRLSDEQQQLLHRYYFDEQTIESLASQFGRSADAIYKCLHRIRLALHNCINHKLQEGF